MLSYKTCLDTKPVLYQGRFCFWLLDKGIHIIGHLPIFVGKASLGNRGFWQRNNPKILATSTKTQQRSNIDRDVKHTRYHDFRHCHDEQTGMKKYEILTTDIYIYDITVYNWKWLCRYWWLLIWHVYVETYHKQLGIFVENLCYSVNAMAFSKKVYFSHLS